MNKVVIIKNKEEWKDDIIGIGSDYYSAVRLMIEKEYLDSETIEDYLKTDAEEIFNLSINEFNDIFNGYYMEEILVYTYL